MNNPNTFILIISGSEILSGRRQDKHIEFITREMAKIGMECLRCVVVGDETGSFESALRAALDDTNLIITTGGLGPTTDDLTREAISAATGIELKEDPAALQMIQDRFNRMNRVMKDNNRLQALVPVSGSFLPNDNGTAPGLVFEKGDKTIVALPGPPRELYPLFDLHVIPYLQKRVPDRVIPIARTFSLCGIGESNVDEVIRKQFDHEPDLIISYLAGLGIVELRLSIQDQSDEARQRLEEYAHKVERLFPEYIFSTVQCSLEETLVPLLHEKKQTLSVAESCTGGMLGGILTSVAGSSSVFHGGLIAYQNKIKQNMLNVNEETLHTHGAVSRECACEMALGICSVFGTDWGISITGIAGPDGGSGKKPVGTVWICIANSSGEVYPFLTTSAGGREAIRQRSCFYALDQLRRLLMGYQHHE